MKEISKFLHQTPSIFASSKKSKFPHINGTIDLSDTIAANPPLLGSLPHFMEGDPKLFEPFEGLKANKSIHMPYAYIHPRLGSLIKGSLCYQLNIRVTSYNNCYKKFNDLILPLVWMEFTIDEMPTIFKVLLFIVSPVGDILEVILKYGSILSFLMSIYHLFKFYVRFTINSS